MCTHLLLLIKTWGIEFVCVCECECIKFLSESDNHLLEIYHIRTRTARPFRLKPVSSIMCVRLAPSLHHVVDDSCNTIWNTKLCVYAAQNFCLNKKWFAWIDAISCRCNQSVYLRKVLCTAIQKTSINRLLYNNNSKMCLHILAPIHPLSHMHTCTSVTG